MVVLCASTCSKWWQHYSKTTRLSTEYNVMLITLDIRCTTMWDWLQKQWHSVSDRTQSVHGLRGKHTPAEGGWSTYPIPSYGCWFLCCQSWHYVIQMDSQYRWQCLTTVISYPLHHVAGIRISWHSLLIVVISNITWTHHQAHSIHYRSTKTVVFSWDWKIAELEYCNNYV